MALTLVSSPRSGTEVSTVDRLNLSLSPGDRPVLVVRSRSRLTSPYLGKGILRGGDRRPYRFRRC